MESKTSFVRRKLIKIPVIVNAINRKLKEKQKPDCQNQEIKEEICNKNEENDNKTTSKDSSLEVSRERNDKKEECIKKVPATNLIDSEHNLDGTVSTSKKDNSSIPDGGIGTDIPKIPVNIVNSDSEYPPPPPSPSKVNRTRIKAVPRLDYRKTSFSASESEDESRKNNRIRNDSICSTTSAIAETVNECFSPQRPREIQTVQPKKCIRSDQTRKIAEARREFQRKFGQNKPERHKLTMMDLIFYNPDSNPIQKDEIKINKDDSKEDVNLKESKAEIKNLVNGEPAQNNEENDEAETAVPVPQIKIGPAGEIIIDEQSIVIERKEVKKKMEEMAKTKIVNGDFDTGYGVYKKRKRSKRWSDHETVRLYKAINIIGTDFTLMTELFPNRTRRELKMKFKKEENMNRALMNRAVMQPGHFDYDELKNEVEREEKELEMLEKQKEHELKQKEEERKLSKQKMAIKAEKRKISEIGNEANLDINKPPKPKRLLRLPKRPRRNKKTDNPFVEDSDADESDIATQSESDDEIESDSEEIVMRQRPTRSGRVPKSVLRYDEDAVATVESVISRSRVPAQAMPVQVEPGSIMIITETGPDGDPIYKVFMVTPDQNAQPVELPVDVLTKAIQMKKGVTAKNIMTISASVTDDETEPTVVENNVTIPADESVTTLKSEKGWSENEAGINGDNVPTIDSENENNGICTITAEDIVPSGEHDAGKTGDDVLMIGGEIEINENVTIPAEEGIVSMRPTSKPTMSVLAD